MPCGTINIEESEQDESQAKIENMEISPYGDFGAKVDFDLVNEVVSGDGETLSATVELLIDGETQDLIARSPEPGASESYSFEVTDLEPGSHEICVEV